MHELVTKPFARQLPWCYFYVFHSRVCFASCLVNQFQKRVTVYMQAPACVCVHDRYSYSYTKDVRVKLNFLFFLSTSKTKRFVIELN